MGDKLRIFHTDGTFVDVEPLKAWDPGDLEPYPDSVPVVGSLERAWSYCKVRGYIARDAKPDKKYWRNTLYWQTLRDTLSTEDQKALDWKHYDPQEDESTALTA